MVDMADYLNRRRNVWGLQVDKSSQLRTEEKNENKINTHLMSLSEYNELLARQTQALAQS